MRTYKKARVLKEITLTVSEILRLTRGHGNKIL